MKGTTTMRRIWQTLGLSAWLLVLASCGGGGGSGGAPAPTVSAPAVAGANVQTVVVDGGPAGMTRLMVNLPYTTVRICVPGTDVCQTIDHVLLDTGSTGLRLLNSAVALTLPAKTLGNLPLYNCVQFIDQSYMWGSMVSADLYLGGSRLDGEKAANLPTELVGAAGAPVAPSTCAPAGAVAKDTVDSLGANGILGVGYSPQDCGGACVSNAGNGYYYVKSANGGVSGTAVSLSDQLQQPVGLFPVDNNGVLISLPSVPASGAASITGNLIFGIGTQSNNHPGTVSVMTFNANGYFSTLFRGRTLTKGFVDSGSNAWFFGAFTYPFCAGSTSWYCPAGTVALQAVNTGANGQSSTVDFSIADVSGLLGNPSIAALAPLSGPIGDNQSFDFGLPFFYGRDVFSAIRGKNSPLGVGPYVAY
jgi:Protein of unknown function (DUF3443)